MDGAGFRTVRAAAFAAPSVLLPIAARLAVTVRPVPVDLVAAAFAGTLALSLPLFASERRFRAIAGLLVPLRLESNLSFNVGQSSCPPGTGGTGGLRLATADGRRLLDPTCSARARGSPAA